MRAELANLNHCAVPFLRRAAANLSWYDSTATVRDMLFLTILLTKTTAAQNEDALSYHKVRGLYFLAVISVATIVGNVHNKNKVYRGT